MKWVHFTISEIKEWDGFNRSCQFAQIGGEPLLVDVWEVPYGDVNGIFEEIFLSLATGWKQLRAWLFLSDWMLVLAVRCSLRKRVEL